MLLTSENINANKVHLCVETKYNIGDHRSQMNLKASVTRPGNRRHARIQRGGTGVPPPLMEKTQSYSRDRRDVTALATQVNKCTAVM